MCESDVGHLWYELKGQECNPLTLDDLFNIWQKENEN
jgi:hypothetical protein